MTKHVSPPKDDAFRNAIVDGLTSERKAINSKWLYDDVGSHLFEAITELDAYYPTRAELEILRLNRAKYARLNGANGILLELGSGSSRKTRLLLDTFTRLSGYMPIDISAGHLEDAAERIRRSYPDLAVIPVAADFTQPLQNLPLIPDMPVLVFFPGSTIGNFEPETATELLENIRLAIQGATMLVGVDRPKAINRLVTAYDDPAGVTAAFNKNLLQRANRELGTDLDLSAFRHRAVWNEGKSRIEMHLESLSDQTVVLDGETVTFGKGETIHTENSHKYDEDTFAEIAQGAGWQVADRDTDRDRLFSVFTLQAE